MRVDIFGLACRQQLPMRLAWGLLLSRAESSDTPRTLQRSLVLFQTRRTSPELGSSLRPFSLIARLCRRGQQEPPALASPSSRQTPTFFLLQRVTVETLSPSQIRSRSLFGGATASAGSLGSRTQRMTFFRCAWKLDQSIRQSSTHTVQFGWYLVMSAL